MEKFLEKITEILRKSNSITYKFFMICKEVKDLINEKKNLLDISSFLYLFSLKHKELKVYLQNDTQ